jgi:two-component system phosphate regulon response regulator PhoB
LQQGADDYVSKPFSPKVLMARVESVLRRLARAKMPLSNESREINGLTIDPDRRKVIATATGQELDLTYSEFEILLLLASKPGWVFTRSQIVDSIRGSNHAITDRSVDVQIVGLRRKLGDLGNIIETVRGAGYRFKE